MNLDLKNKKVFISGSTKGIGFETARVFLEEGASVIINGRTQDSVEEAIKKLNNKNVSGLVADFLDDSQVCLLYTSPSPRDVEESRMPSSA